jgi:hypothetical protein
MITARLEDDGTVVEIRPDESERPLMREVDWARVDATTEEEIAAQIIEDETEAMRDAAPPRAANPAPPIERASNIAGDVLAAPLRGR